MLQQQQQQTAPTTEVGTNRSKRQQLYLQIKSTSVPTRSERQQYLQIETTAGPARSKRQQHQYIEATTPRTCIQQQSQRHNCHCVCVNAVVLLWSTLSTCCTFPSPPACQIRHPTPPHPYPTPQHRPPHLFSPRPNTSHFIRTFLISQFGPCVLACSKDERLRFLKGSTPSTHHANEQKTKQKTW